MMAIKNLLPAALLWMGGCTWISTTDLDSRRGQVDDDGDGFSATEDCDDADATFYPSAVEVWYDGRDQDCLLDDDYDADLDGLVADEHAGLPTEGVDGSGKLPGGDCDDADATIYDGAPDSWYDGIDSDCSLDDDYDADTDGYVLDENAGLVTAGVDASGALPAGDCDDADATISPEVAEVWYDGIDQDCSEETDDGDQDADGYIAEASGGDDCDDDAADVYPGALETLTDGVDRDCDGGPATFALGTLPDFSEELVSLSWDEPFDVRFDSNSTGIYLSVAAIAATLESESGGASITSNFYDSALAFAFDRTDPTLGLLETIDWQRNSADPGFYLTRGHDIIVDDDALYGVTGLQVDTTRALRIGGYDFAKGANFGINYTLTDPDGKGYADFEDISLAVDADGDLHALGCESAEGNAQYLTGSAATIRGSGYEVAGKVEELEISACEMHFYDDPQGTLLTAEIRGMATWTWDSTSPPPDLAFSGVDTFIFPLDLEMIRGAPEAWVLAANAIEGNVAILTGPDEYTLDVGGPPAAVQGVWDDLAGEIVIGYTTSDGRVGVAWGHPNPVVGMEVFEFPVDFAARDVAVALDASTDHLLIAVLGDAELAFGIVRRY